MAIKLDEAKIRHLNTNGVTTIAGGHIYLTGAQAGSSTGNTTQIVFGTANDNHIALSSNSNAFIINPTTSSTTNQIVLYLNQKSKFPSGIDAGAGGITTTGNISGNYIQGTWLYTSAATAQTTTSKIAVIHSDNYIYYITPADLTTLIKNNASGTWSISVSGSSASCTGNAATATAFSSAASISLSGDVTGSASSTKGWSITTTANKISYPAQLTTDDAINNFNAANKFQVATWNSTSSPGVSNGIIMSGGWTSTTYGWQIAIDDDPTWYIALRQRNGDGWKAWKRIPMGDGTGASGTWGISISGNAATATKLGTSTVGAADRPIYLNSGTATQTTYRMAATNASATSALAITSDLPTGIWYVSGTSGILGQSDGVVIANQYSSSWITEIYQDYRTGQLAVRGKNNGTWQSWRKVLDSTNYSSYALPLAGGTMNAGAQILRASSSQSWVNGRKGALLAHAYASANRFTDNQYNPLWSAKSINGSWDCGTYTANNNLYFTYITDTNFDAGTNTTTHQVIISGNDGKITASGFIGNLSGNATTATTASKTQAALSLNGKSFNGSVAVDMGTLGVAYGGTGRTSLVTPTATWGAGSTAGPTLIIKDSLNQSSSAATIPTASTTASGIVIVGDQNFKGMKTFYGPVRGYMYNLNNNAPAFIFDKPGSYWTGIGANGASNTIFFGPCQTDSNAAGGWSWVSNFNQIWKFQGTVEASSGFTGNASSATKLATPRAINGTNFDGSAAITTANWGTARTISISSTAGTTGTSVNGSTNVSLVIPSTMTGFNSITSTSFRASSGIYYGRNASLPLLVPDAGDFYYSNVDSSNTSGNDVFRKGAIKLLCANNTGFSGVLIGRYHPNSHGILIGDIYSTSTVNSTTGLPQYSTFWASNLSGEIMIFGTSSYNYYERFVLDSSNYTSYTVKKDGTGASGNWGINITGNAASATKLGAGAATWAYFENTDELNFGGTATSTTLYMAYRSKDSRPIPTKFVFGGSSGSANLQCNTVYLGSGTSSYISSTQYTGNAATASKVNGVIPEWSGSIAWADTSWIAAWNADGTKIKALAKSSFAAAGHTHSYLPLSGGTLSGTLKWSNALTKVTSPTVVAAFIGNDSANGLGYASASDLSVGYATKVKLASTGISATATTDALLEPGVRFDTVAAAGTSINNDGVVATFGYSASWGAQIFLDDGSGAANMYVRNRASTSAWNSWRRVWMQGDSVTGAVWNDYAEYRESDCKEFGRVLAEKGDDTLTKTTERLQPFAGVSSDTWGFCQGETEKAKTPIAVAGRVLVYTYRDRKEYKPGDVVCAAPNGTVDIMTREEIITYPDRIVGTVSCVPEYETWGSGDRDPVKVNNRIWIKVN